MFAIGSTLAYLLFFWECATPPHIQVRHHVTQFYQAFPHVSTASDNAGARRPGYEASVCSLSLPEDDVEEQATDGKDNACTGQDGVGDEQSLMDLPEHLHWGAVGGNTTCWWVVRREGEGGGGRRGKEEERGRRKEEERGRGKEEERGRGEGQKGGER